MKRIALGLLVATAALSLSGCKKAEEPTADESMEATEAAPMADESAAASDMATDDASTAPAAEDDNNPNGPSAD